MPRGTVIAIDHRGTLFALRGPNSKAAVFYKHLGPDLEVGDELEGNLFADGVVWLEHANGKCGVNCDTGSIPIAQAMCIVNASR